jgi:hypothetical protein
MRQKSFSSLGFARHQMITNRRCKGHDQPAQAQGGGQTAVTQQLLRQFRICFQLKEA